MSPSLAARVQVQVSAELLPPEAEREDLVQVPCAPLPSPGLCMSVSKFLPFIRTTVILDWGLP